MKKLLILVMVSIVGLFFTGCEKELTEDLAPTPQMKKPGGAGTNFTNPNRFDANGITIIGNGGSYSIGDPMQLWMGVGNAKAGTLVGSASFITVGGVDKVRIDLTDSDGDGTPDMYPYIVTVAHIDFADTQAGLAQTKKGNPIPGQFEYNYPVTGNSSVIEVPVTSGFKDFGAIHLDVVKLGGVNGFNYYLPNNEVTMRITSSSTTGDSSYVTLQITGGGFISTYDNGDGDGIYPGWCVAKGLNISYNTDYQAYLYSSYEDIPVAVSTAANLYVANLDNINWLLNNFAEFDPIIIGGVSYGLLTDDDLQKALWNLSNRTTYSSMRINHIVNAALASGDGYEPGCNDRIVFIAVPTNTSGTTYAQLIVGQPTIAQVQVPCVDEGGTAWGDGYWGATFGGSNWGTWFEYEAD